MILQAQFSDVRKAVLFDVDGDDDDVLALAISSSGWTMEAKLLEFVSLLVWRSRKTTLLFFFLLEFENLALGFFPGTISWNRSERTGSNRLPTCYY